MKPLIGLNVPCFNQWIPPASLGNIQGTRGLMLSSILLCCISMLVAVVGMKCTTCLAEQPEQKDKVALAGGVVFIFAGET